MKILISKNKAEIVDEKDKLIEVFDFLSKKYLTVVDTYRICKYYVKSFYQSEDIKLITELHNQCFHIPKDDLQRFFIEVSKLCYSLEIDNV